METVSTGAEPVPEAYGSQAGRYEQRTGAFRHWRELLVDKLPARRGDTVLDVGCGTGLCLPLLQRKVGASGTIVGIDESEQMPRVAGERVAAAGGKWPAPWLWPLQAWVTVLHAPFVNDFTGFDRPWRLLAQFVPDLRVHELAFGPVTSRSATPGPLDTASTLDLGPRASAISGWESLP